ncbi:MAG: BREX system P-loop protein BrxC, partial [Verrucomicrobiota bacterium]
TKLADLRARVGNDRLKGLLDEVDALKPEVAKWKKQAELASRRVPEWEKLQKFLSAGARVGALTEAETAAKGILDGRLLLDNSDHVPPLLKQVAQALRAAVAGAHGAFAKRHAELLNELEASEAWQKISGTQRITIMSEEGISSVPDLEVGSDEQLLAALQQTPVSSWNDKTAALTARFQNAARKGARLLEPKTQYVTLKSDTLRTESDVKAWLGEQETKLLAELKKGPVVVG